MTTTIGNNNHGPIVVQGGNGNHNTGIAYAAEWDNRSSTNNHNVGNVTTAYHQAPGPAPPAEQQSRVRSCWPACSHAPQTTTEWHQQHLQTDERASLAG